MRALAVIGANFGDEGKGLLVDHLCASRGAGVVVRFNGGAQAGHTVVTEDGARHVFSHFGSGTLRDVPTYLSQFFVCNPILFFQERAKLARLGFNSKVYAHPDCLVTTFTDMMINQFIESKRGAKRHGSCGVGFHETQNRSQVAHLKITMADLWNGGRRLEAQLEEICGKYAKFRTGESMMTIGDAKEQFVACCREFANQVNPLGIQQCTDPIFEGAQGLLLDQDRKEFFPHVTHSKTGMHNVRTLCAQAGIDEVETWYVSRTYLTRHGAGPLPGEDAGLEFEDSTNIDHPYQGGLRFAHFTRDGHAKLSARCDADAGHHDWKLAFTHCDQNQAPWDSDLFSYGPRRDDITTKARELATA